ncbi:DUF4442 domain-containing protein [Streptomyces albireticuli]|uniref:DUF4442 domain-containing protein n=1 Tax=Streptomyces albireticuli TaxID=1940 RepID=UPI0036D1D785
MGRTGNVTDASRSDFLGTARSRWEISLNSHPLPSTTPRLPSFEDIRAFVNEVVPFQKFVGAEVRELGPGRAVAALPDSHDMRNHVGTTHAAALFLLAEAAAGAALAGALRERVTATVFILRESRIEYRRKALGEIRAVADTPVDGIPEGYPYLPAGERFDVVVRAHLQNAEGEFLADAAFTYHCKILPG